MTLPTVAMDALMTITALTYDDLAEIADILTRLFSAEGQVLDLNQQLGAARRSGDAPERAGVRARTHKRATQERGSLVQGGHCNSAQLVRQAAPRLWVMTGNRVHVRLRSVRRPFMPLSCTGPYRLPYTRTVHLSPHSPAAPRRCPEVGSVARSPALCSRSLRALSRPACVGANRSGVRYFMPSGTGAD